MTSLGDVNVYWASVFGFFLGFAFGVGCALAVMYSIYMGGYRAAVRDSLLPCPPERLRLARSRALAPATPSPDSPEPDPATSRPDPDTPKT
jgi:hypothetical protein